MKIIKYHFVDGTIKQVEVSDEIAKVMDDYRKIDENSRKKYFRHCISLDAIEYEGNEFGAEDQYCFDIEESEKICRQVRNAMKALTPKQRKRLWLYAQGFSIHTIARIENISFYSAWKSVNGAKKKFACILGKI